MKPPWYFVFIQNHEILDVFWEAEVRFLLLILDGEPLRKPERKKNQTWKKHMQPYKLITMYLILAEKESIWDFVWWLISHRRHKHLVVRIERHKPAEMRGKKQHKQTYTHTHIHSIAMSPASAIGDELTDLLYTYIYVFIANDFYSLLCLFVSVFAGK